MQNILINSLFSPLSYFKFNREVLAKKVIDFFLKERKEERKKERKKEIVTCEWNDIDSWGQKGVSSSGSNSPSHIPAQATSRCTPTSTLT